MNLRQSPYKNTYSANCPSNSQGNIICLQRVLSPGVAKRVRSKFVRAATVSEKSDTNLSTRVAQAHVNHTGYLS